MEENLTTRLVSPARTRIAMIIMDGLGGLPLEPGGKTELESAFKPNMDRLAERSALGLTIPVAPGITAGSGPGHLAIFGYDPVRHEIGRGALEALGVDFELRAQDVAARGNFCTLDEGGNITDRRAGRLPTGQALILAKLLRQIELPGAQVFIEPVKEHRFAFILRGEGLSSSLSDSDPQQVGVPPLPVLPTHAGARDTAVLVNGFIEQAQTILAGGHLANGVLLRGFAHFPQVPGYLEKYGLNSAAIAINGLYRGVAVCCGMHLVPIPGSRIEDEFSALEACWADYDFFYLHVKQTDTAGEKGDFQGKVRAIEEVDAQLPRLLALDPDVIIISGDHSSPAVLKSHSWHPVPTLLYAKHVFADGIAEFGERACRRGSLGLLPATQIMTLAMANAQRLSKYGA